MKNHKLLFQFGTVEEEVTPAEGICDFFLHSNQFRPLQGETPVIFYLYPLSSLPPFPGGRGGGAPESSQLSLR